MNSLFKFILAFFILAVVEFAMMGQSGGNAKNKDLALLPKSFLIGEYEPIYENLLTSYDVLLITLCNNDHEKAYRLYTNLLLDMQDYAHQVNFDLNGIKLWLNIFFNADGSLQHIVYFPKPNSKNLSYDDLTAFFVSFCKSYRLKEPLSSKCLLNTTASFPVFGKRS